jgi:hypothetical protein
MQPPPSSLLISPPTYACRKWLSTFHVDNGQSLCMLHNIFFLSLPQKNSYRSPTPTKKKSRPH